jgi:hypothetical protein
MFLSTPNANMAPILTHTANTGSNVFKDLDTGKAWLLAERMGFELMAIGPHLT